MTTHKVVMTDLLATAIQKGIGGIESEIRSVENELAERAETVGKDNPVNTIIEVALAELHQYADILRGTLARYEDSKK